MRKTNDEKIVLKVGGSIIQNNRGEVHVDLVREYALMIKELRKEGFDITAVIVGGGAVSKRFASYARKLGASEGVCDVVGIQATRLNAYLFIAAIGDDAYQVVPRTLNEVAQASATGKVIVVGGLQPGQSTSAVAALVAERLRANKLINATDVKGVFTSDPKRNPEAKIIPKMTTKELQDIILSSAYVAGGYELFDLIALKVIERAGILLVVLDGRNTDNVRLAVKGEHVGTWVYPCPGGD